MKPAWKLESEMIENTEKYLYIANVVEHLDPMRPIEVELGNKYTKIYAHAVRRIVIQKSAEVGQVKVWLNLNAGVGTFQGREMGLLFGGVNELRNHVSWEDCDLLPQPRDEVQEFVDTIELVSRPYPVLTVKSIVKQAIYEWEEKKRGAS